MLKSPVCRVHLLGHHLCEEGGMKMISLDAAMNLMLSDNESLQATKAVNIDGNILRNKIIPFTTQYVNELHRSSNIIYLSIIFDMAEIFEYNAQQKYPWRDDVIKWSIETLHKNTNTGFARKNASHFLSALISSDIATGSKLIPDLIELVIESGDQFHDWISNLVIQQIEQVSPDGANHIIESAPKREMFSLDFCELLAAVMTREQKFSCLHDNTQWLNNKLRLTTMKMLIENNEITELIHSLLVDPESRLDHFTVCYKYLPEKAQKEGVEKWIRRLDRLKMCQAEHIKQFLKICAPFTVEQFDVMYKVMKERFERNHSLFKYLTDACPAWVKLRCSSIVCDIFDRLSSSSASTSSIIPDLTIVDWSFAIFEYILQCIGDENCDFLLTKLMLLLHDDNEILREKVIRCLALHATEKQLHRLALKDERQQTRLSAIDILSARIEAGKTPSSNEETIVGELLTDSDLCVRERAICYAGKLIQLGGTVGDNVRQILSCSMNDDDNNSFAKSRRELLNVPNSQSKSNSSDQIDGYDNSNASLSDLVSRITLSDYVNNDEELDCF
ncbi:unnamed protein product [Anisakis simplex]|uniref:Cnd3 domain-containing protein n=1 Tax=Anisakis simplex TaxID=6269 RepID=A0A0M3JYJ3_ANISI|nr:unnamed protein product [Anisakis simplex]